MAVDTPARIAVLGAGPVGLEAALYARFLGYQVDIFERDQPGANLLRWGQVRMFSPFGLNSSPLGLAALAAQDSNFRAPCAEEILTGRQWWERYVLPLSKTDLLVDHIHSQTTVVAVAKAGLLKSEAVGQVARDDAVFRLLLRDADGNESIQFADVVIDTTGVFGNPNWLGDGGIPAQGELAFRSQIEYGLPDVLERDRDRFANRHTLVVGGGFSAATTALALQQLIAETPLTTATWLTRNAPGAEILERIPGDPLLERDRLVHAANRLARVPSTRFRYLAGCSVSRIVELEASLDQLGGSRRWSVEVQPLSGEPIELITCDQLVANVGYRPDTSIYSELQVQECYASQGPLKLAAVLSGSSGDCLQQKCPGPSALLNPEPHFYILGSKSYGRNSHFLFQTGLQQIRDLFTVIGDRAALDLYDGVPGLGR